MEEHELERETLLKVITLGIASLNPHPGSVLSVFLQVLGTFIIVERDRWPADMTSVVSDTLRKLADCAEGGAIPEDVNYKMPTKDMN